MPSWRVTDFFRRDHLIRPSLPGQIVVVPSSTICSLAVTLVSSAQKPRRLRGMESIQILRWSLFTALLVGFHSSHLELLVHALIVPLSLYCRFSDARNFSTFHANPRASRACTPRVRPADHRLAADENQSGSVRIDWSTVCLKMKAWGTALWGVSHPSIRPLTILEGGGPRSSGSGWVWLIDSKAGFSFRSTPEIRLTGSRRSHIAVMASLQQTDPLIWKIGMLTFHMHVQQC